VSDQRVAGPAPGAQDPGPLVRRPGDARLPPHHDRHGRPVRCAGPGGEGDPPRPDLKRVGDSTGSTPIPDSGILLQARVSPGCTRCLSLGCVRSLHNGRGRARRSPRDHDVDGRPVPRRYTRRNRPTGASGQAAFSFGPHWKRRSLNNHRRGSANSRPRTVTGLCDGFWSIDLSAFPGPRRSQIRLSRDRLILISGIRKDVQAQPPLHQGRTVSPPPPPRGGLPRG